MEKNKKSGSDKFKEIPENKENEKTVRVDATEQTVLIDKDDKTMLMDNQDKTHFNMNERPGSDKKLEKTAEIFDSASLFNSELGESNPDIMEMDSTRFPNIMDYRRASVSSSKDKVTFNRNFLKDAGPINLKEILSEIRAEIPPLVSGIPEFDETLCFPPSTISSFSGNYDSNKELLILNIMFNMADIYRDLHFIYYSYNTKKLDIERLLINLASPVPFERDDEIIKKIVKENPSINNIGIWNYILKNNDEEQLLKLSKEREDMRGLHNFLQLSARIHIIDRCYDIHSLLKSIELFDTSHLKIGSIFIDSLHLIPGNPYSGIAIDSQLKESSKLVLADSFGRNFPLIITADADDEDNEILKEISTNFINVNKISHSSGKKRTGSYQELMKLDIIKSNLKKQKNIELQIVGETFKII